MPDITANLALPYLAASQAQKHVTHNEALQILDAVVQLAVVDRDRTDPPAEPGAGARHIVALGATGAWSGQSGHVALWTGNAWMFIAPQTGWRAWIAAEDCEVVWHDGLWQSLTDFNNLAGVGINTTSDATNRLSVSAPATLLNHEGSGHQLKINKAAADDTASLLFQTGFSGRAEMGLAGGDAWSIKVSDDGANWTEALALDPVSGLASGAAVQANAYDSTADRLMKTGAFGLGAQTAAQTNSLDMDTETLPSGFYSGHSWYNTPLGNLGPSSWSVLWVQVLGSEGDKYRRQIYYAGTSAANHNETWTRTKVAGVWGAWRRAYDTGNFIGPVSVSGGVPTGAIMESGNNANGGYVRFADGTQICTVSGLTLSATEETTWTLPSEPVYPAHPNRMAFSGNVGTFGTNYLTFNGYGAPGKSIKVSAYSHSGTQVAGVASIMAIGRWF